MEELPLGELLLGDELLQPLQLQQMLLLMFDDQLGDLRFRRLQSSHVHLLLLLFLPLPTLLLPRRSGRMVIGRIIRIGSGIIRKT